MDASGVVLAATSPLFSGEWVEGLVGTLVYGVMGMLMFALSVWLMERLTPFSLRKELEEDQNVAVGVLMGAIVIGIAIIFAASISG